MAMNNKFKYDPENLEYLLLNKQYNELRETEKIYVLKHLSSPEEYAQMRQALLSTVQHNPAADDLLKPNKHIKEQLLQQFKEQRQVERMAWLNVLFAPLRELQPAIKITLGGLAVAIILVVGLIFFTDGEQPQQQLADNQNTETSSKPERPEERQANAETATKEQPKKEQEEADIHMNKEVEKSSQMAEENKKKRKAADSGAELKEIANTDKLARTSADTEPANPLTGSISNNGNRDDKESTTSSALADDEELIALLFTAM